MDHVDKYYWIIDHPKFTKYGGQATIELCPQRVNPLTCSIVKDETLNTKYEWWVELSYQGKMEDSDMKVTHGEYCSIHDWSLDCGGDTAEDAVDMLYKLVLDKYGDYEE